MDDRGRRSAWIATSARGKRISHGRIDRLADVAAAFARVHRSRCRSAPMAASAQIFRHLRFDGECSAAHSCAAGNHHSWAQSALRVCRNAKQNSQFAHVDLVRHSDNSPTVGVHREICATDRDHAGVVDSRRHVGTTGSADVRVVFLFFVVKRNDFVLRAGKPTAHESRLIEWCAVAQHVHSHVYPGKRDAVTPMALLRCVAAC